MKQQFQMAKNLKAKEASKAQPIQRAVTQGEAGMPKMVGTD